MTKISVQESYDNPIAKSSESANNFWGLAILVNIDNISTRYIITTIYDRYMSF